MKKKNRGKEKVLESTVRLIKHYCKVLLVPGWDFYVTVVDDAHKENKMLSGFIDRKSKAFAYIGNIDVCCQCADIVINEVIPQPFSHRDVVIHEMVHVLLAKSMLEIEELLEKNRNKGKNKKETEKELFNIEETLAWRITKIIRRLEDRYTNDPLEGE